MVEPHYSAADSKLGSDTEMSLQTGGQVDSSTSCLMGTHPAPA
eukprot:CAMPEP_0177263234 /NCGR_PEP_ID=MMETSP0367-20130122/60872_1 /TAXON_ID=447022 ORGANISM="Scrippsiella hangoei-like, Strain SHHI-4" /NCGR_SAMPLE_ID=MMETSP0367 /ASSEMBLY_ACC=CAM_ASM_000362 /LENGTH=42 /DNA_ID= /DNA_START= /DNA_END= /DNA_ORIENTATION=